MKRPDEAELLAWLDGDFEPERRAEIQQHLETDWELRTTLQQLERRIGRYVEATAHQTPAEIEPFDDFWSRSSARLDAITASPHLLPQESKTSHLKTRMTQLFALQARQWRFALAAGVATIFVAGLSLYLFFAPSVRPVSAEELLQRSIRSEELRLGQLAEPVVYRKLQVRRGGEAVAWESWTNPQRQQFHQRVANQQSGRSPQSSDRTAPPLLNELEHILRLNHLDEQRPLSAAAFAKWRQSIRPVAETVTESTEGLMLTTSVAEPHALNAIREASLLVRKNDWQAVALSLQVQGEKEIQSYELREMAYEILSAQAVTVFAEAAPTNSALVKSSPSPSPVSAASEAAPVAAAHVAIASAELEVEVLERLNQVNALLGEQLGLTRTAEGKLLLEGLVETDARKGELLQALESVVGNPAVKIAVSTVAEAQARQSESLPRQVIVQEAQVAQQAIPVETELRNYLSNTRGLSGERLEQEMQRFSGQICSRSSRASSHALALKQIGKRFTPAQLQTLHPATRDRFSALLKEHAQGYRRELDQLRQQLQPIFPVAAETVAAPGKLGSDDELLSAINRLFKLAATNDAKFCQSFSVSTEAAAAAAAAAVKQADFWRTVSNAENLAAQIANWQ